MLDVLESGHSQTITLQLLRVMTPIASYVVITSVVGAMKVRCQWHEDDVGKLQLCKT